MLPSRQGLESVFPVPALSTAAPPGLRAPGERRNGAGDRNVLVWPIMLRAGGLGSAVVGRAFKCPRGPPQTPISPPPLWRPRPASLGCGRHPHLPRVLLLHSLPSLAEVSTPPSPTLARCKGDSTPAPSCSVYRKYSLTHLSPRESFGVPTPSPCVADWHMFTL